MRHHLVLACFFALSHPFLHLRIGKWDSADLLHPLFLLALKDTVSKGEQFAFYDVLKDFRFSHSDLILKCVTRTLKHQGTSGANSNALTQLKNLRCRRAEKTNSPCVAPVNHALVLPRSLLRSFLLMRVHALRRVRAKPRFFCAAIHPLFGFFPLDL